MVVTPRTSTVGQLDWPALLALFLVPGAMITIADVALAPVAEAAGFPPIAALLVAILIVLVPVELGIVIWAGRGEGRSLRSIVPPAHRLPWTRLVWLVPLLIVAAFVGFGLSMAVEPAVIDGLFGWLPDWFVQPIDPNRIGDYERDAWLLTLGAYVLLNGLMGPIVEELYFRGYLLPRMQWLGRWAPLVNVTLFSLYHFWSPWQIVGRILGFGPTVAAVQWTRNVYLGMVVHCTLNILGISLVANMVLGRI
jgi:membrane protease YdiL (CAAX protease family)